MMHAACAAFCLAAESAGRSNAARMEIMAMTTKSSIKVKARRKFIPDKMAPSPPGFNHCHALMNERLGAFVTPPPGRNGALGFLPLDRIVS